MLKKLIVSELLMLEAEEEEEHELALLSSLTTTRNRSCWVKNHVLSRNMFGEFHRLIPDLDEKEFKIYFRMTRTQFYFIHNEIKEIIMKQDTSFRSAISTEERLAVCLRYLSTGMCFRTLAQSYRLGETTVGMIVRQVCDALWHKLQPTILHVPQQSDWENIAQKYNELWQFPNCLGAIDGKHVTIKKPAGTESEHHNYKDTFSFVLLAVVDADYKFTIVDIGSSGRYSDGSIFIDSQIGKKIRDNKLNVPPFRTLEGSNNDSFPYVFVGDEAFPLMTNMMRPFPKSQLHTIRNKVFNYRLSRARRMVESSFGILAARWRIFLKPFECNLDNAITSTKAAIVLHNFLRQGGGSVEQELRFFESTEPQSGNNQQMQRLQRVGCNASRFAFQTRDKFAEYFISPAGSVPWQMSAIQKGHF